MRLRLAILAACLALPATAPAQVHHDLEVSLDLAAGRLEVRDRLRVPPELPRDGDGGIRFLLHAGLAPRVADRGWTLEPVAGAVDGGFVGINASSETVAEGVPLEGWRLRPGEGAGDELTLAYGGAIHHPLATSGEEYQRSFSETPGLIGEEGVFLAGTSFWVPTFGDGLLTFTLAVSDLPAGWNVVSQGRRRPEGEGVVGWTADRPTEEVYLVAGRWHEWTDRAEGVELTALLRSDEPALARRYLDATARYLRLYSGLLPPYPFESFTLVENFWETGYGMPGFTLLGPRVIRFPWILTSSYPHELVHSWWGNSVYVDYNSGNWCEGLTAYLADHLLAEQRGEGALYRRATLQKYADFAASGSDLPLVDFRGRRSAATEAVGYGKALMVFHMLRRDLGDERFGEALRRFWERHRFSRASWSDLAAAVSEVGGEHLGAFLAEWTTRIGAPRLEIGGVFVRRDLDGPDPWQVEVVLRQVPATPGFPMRVPVAVTVEGRAEPLLATTGPCSGGECRAVLACPARPLRLDVDPAFDVMRTLDPLELPPALSTLFGADDPLFVLPASADEAERTAWRELAAAWARPGEPRIALDRELEGLPTGPVWLLGAANRFADDAAARLADQRVELSGEALSVGEGSFPRRDRSLVLVARADDPDDAIGWVASDRVAAIAGLARKLPHYTRYGWLAFTGDEPENVGKGLWRPVGSPLVRALADGPLPELRLPEREPLAEMPPAVEPAALAATVAALADPDLEGRGLGSAGLARATAWVEGRLDELGLEPAGDDGFRQRWTWTGGEPPRELELTNLVARIPGSDPALAGNPVLVTAHLDHLGRGWPDVRAGNEGLVHPGADDNASGVAALLELARMLAEGPPRPRPVLLAVTTAEEAGLVGARHLLAGLAPDRLPSACVNLDTVGRLGDGKILVLDASSAREWRFLWMGVAATNGAAIEVVSERLDASDQGACLELGVPGVQLTTGPHADYHRPSDTVEKIDSEGLAVVVEAAQEAVAYLAERREPLTAQLDSAPDEAAQGPAAPRRAALGTVPDFAHPGPGVRVDEVMPGSPAEAAGIRPGDLLLALGGVPIEDLRGYAAALRERSPGDRVEIALERGGERLTTTATLAAR